jgi:hypothetical protein
LPCRLVDAPKPIRTMQPVARAQIVTVAPFVGDRQIGPQESEL